jgi:hypothetical protein
MSLDGTPGSSRSIASLTNYCGPFQSFKSFNRCAPFKTFEGLKTRWECPRFRNSGNVDMSGDYRRPKHQIIPIALAIRDAII